MHLFLRQYFPIYIYIYTYVILPRLSRLLSAWGLRGDGPMAPWPHGSLSSASWIIQGAVLRALLSTWGRRDTQFFGEIRHSNTQIKKINQDGYGYGSIKSRTHYKSCGTINKNTKSKHTQKKSPSNMAMALSYANKRQKRSC